MAGAAVADLADVHAALEAVVPRLCELIRGIRRPDAHGVGDWTVGDVARHLVDVWQVLPALARGAMDSPLTDVRDLSAMTTSLVRDKAGIDGAAVACRIEAAADAYLRTTRGGQAPDDAPWLVAGIRVDPATFACHLLNESLVHGYDIAQGEGVRWTIEPSHAALALMGFMFPTLSRLDPRALVDQQRAAGLRATYEVRVRGAGRVYLTFDDGALAVAPTAPPSRPVDCHISADPAALFLVVWGRRAQWGAILRGGMIVWGRRPWLGARLRTLVTNP